MKIVSKLYPLMKIASKLYPNYKIALKFYPGSIKVVYFPHTPRGYTYPRSGKAASSNYLLEFYLAEIIMVYEGNLFENKKTFFLICVVNLFVGRFLTFSIWLCLFVHLTFVKNFNKNVFDQLFSRKCYFKRKSYCCHFVFLA